MKTQTHLPYTNEKHSYKVGIKLNSHYHVRLRDNVITFDFDGETPLFESVEFLINNEILCVIDDPEVLKNMLDSNSLRFDTVEDNITIMNSSYEIPLFAIPTFEYRLTPKGEGTYSNFVLHTKGVEHTREYNQGVMDCINYVGKTYFYNDGLFRIKPNFITNFVKD